MDPIGDMLRALRLTGGIFLDVRLTDPWAVRSVLTPEDVVPFIPKPGHVIGYHVVTEGRAMVGVPGEPAVELRAGEVVLVPHGEMHVLDSGVALPPLDAKALMRPGPDGGMMRIDHGGGGAATRIYCGFLGLAGRFNPLVAGLPRMVKLDVRGLAARDWIEATVRFAAEGLAEGRLPPTDVVSRLSESLLIEAVRQYLDDHPDRPAGWLSGARDPQIGRALALIHGQGGDLTVGRLAAEAAMSRSAFVARFTALVGEPPARYVTRLRLEAARARLGDSDDTVAQVAWDFGYGSEEAFSRAFRRAFGAPPGRWRDGLR